MNRWKRRSAAALVTLLTAVSIGWTAPSASAPTPQATASPPVEEPVGTFREETRVAWVLVPVGVQDGGRWVRDLDRRHFRLSVDGEPVAFPDFDATDAAVSLVFLQDLSGSMANGGKLEASRAALGELIAAAAPADELALASFAGGELAVEVPFTREESVLTESMALWQAYGTTALHDAVAWIPEIAIEGRHPKRAVVLITDGVDNASQLDPAAAREVVRRARLPVFVLGLGRESLGAAAGDIFRGDVRTYGALLQRLAGATGGRYLPLARPEDAAAAARGLLDELRSQYVLAFPTAPGPAAERLLSVSVESVGATVYHRRAYFGGPPL
ncbi:MAG TPA: VWA domain-containing protein [Thermoanaerobaculia bacterium]|nr:VWA domain-containing protein [Thermoanaerobaculia bacterium]